MGIDLERSKDEIVSVNLIDHYRIHVELILFVLFCLLLIGYAGWTGLKALVSFAFTAVVIWKALLPLFLLGWNPVLISLGVVALLSAVIIFLVGGLEKKGLVAFLGALSGIALTCIFSLVFGAGFKIHGAVKPFSETLLYSSFAHLNLARIFLAGVFLAQGTPMVNVFNLNYVSSEVLHTLVGSFGLVLVAPLTAVIGGLLYPQLRSEADPDEAPRATAAAGPATGGALQE